MGELAAQLAEVFPETRRHYARCLKKLGYASPEEAEAVRRRRQTLTEEILHVYGPCQDCGGWHLTHKPLSTAQILAEEAQISEEMARYERSVKAMRAMLRPFQRGHSMYRKSFAEIDQEILASWEMYVHCNDTYMAYYQRETLLARARATDAREVRAIDQEAVQYMAECEEELHEQARRRDALREHYRNQGQDIINQEYPLPAFDWRQHLTHTGG
jgi:hypothetical protein